MWNGPSLWERGWRNEKSVILNKRSNPKITTRI
jgi:hypothetical protein